MLINGCKSQCGLQKEVIILGTQVTHGRISAYKAHLRAKGVAAAAINSQRGVLCHAFKKAIREWEWVKENPVEKVSREKVRNERDRWLTLEDENRLIDACVIYATGKERTSRFPVTGFRR